MTKPFEPGTKVIFVGANTKTNARCVGFEGIVRRQIPKPDSPNAREFEGPFYMIETQAKKAMFPFARNTLLSGVPHQVLRRFDDPPKVETPATSEEIPA